MMTKAAIIFVTVAVGVRALITGTDWLQFSGLVVVALLSLAGTAVTVRSARQAARDKEQTTKNTAKIAVDAEAYARARESYEASILNYEREMRTLDKRVEQAEHRAERAEDRAVQAEREVVRLRGRLMLFEALLAQHQVPVPPEEP